MKQDPDLREVLSYYMVAFVDLLGQREALSTITEIPDPDKGGETEEFLDKLKATFGVVKGFSSMFENFFKNFVRRPSNIDELPDELRDVYDRLDNNPIKFQRYSDGILISMSLLETENRAPIRGVFGVLAACASQYILLLSQGHPLRAGIEVGIGAEMSDGSLYGPVLFRAYDLETRVAQYPRMVIGPECLNFLRATAGYEGGDLHRIVSARMGEKCLALLKMDTDGYHIIDYLGQGYRESVASSLDPAILSKGYQFVLQQMAKHKNEKNTKLAHRYQLLKDYFDSSRVGG